LFQKQQETFQKTVTVSSKEKKLQLVFRKVRNFSKNLFFLITPLLKL